MKAIKTLSIDLAKNLTQVLALDASGQQVFNRKVSVGKLGALIQSCAPDNVVMEACGTAHYWGRECQRLGVKPALIPPHVVTPFRCGDKTDSNDCWAIYEASLRPKINFVPVKSEEHQLLQTWIRRREALVKEQTQRINAIRAYLAEFGHIIPKGATHFRKAAVALLQNWQSNLRLKDLLESDLKGLRGVAEQIEFVDEKIHSYAKTNPICIALQQIKGIGPITAVALVAAVVDPRLFKNGRHFAALLGLVPRKSGTGGKVKLYGISKNGNAYLRTLLIHGGRSVIWNASHNDDDVSRWALKKKEQKGFNKASVAVANKNARKAWAVMAQAFAA